MKKIAILLLLLLACDKACAASPAPKAKPASIVVFDSILLGGFEDRKWISPAETATKIVGGESYALYSSEKYLGNDIGSAVVQCTEGGSDCEIVSIQTNKSEDLSLLALHDKKGKLSWNPAPRKATMLGSENETYKKVVKDILAKNGLPDARPQIMQIFRVDLEGDGVDEVVLYAQNIADPKEHPNKWKPDQSLLKDTGVRGGSKKGDYSLLLLRKIVGGKIQEILLDSFFATRDGSPVDEKWVVPIVHKIFQFADVNGDGVMEILTGSAYYEGFSYSVYAVKGGDVKAVLTNGIGY